MLFGRSAELATGKEVLDLAASERGGVLVLSGEPGIGKSALARALAEAARAAGGRVAFGRAWEVGGAPAYWPWTQALSELGIELEAVLGTTSELQSATQRLVAFDRVVKSVFALAADALLLIVLDDLHAADSASLELALALARGIARHKVALVVTTRESELRQDSKQAELVAKLAREGQRLSLRRLGEAEISEWLVSKHFGGNAAEVLRLTEGNPLFVEEAVRLGVDRFAGLAAGGVPVILREHIERASAETRAVLATASVFGREAAPRDVAALAEIPTDAVDAAQREGVTVGVVTGARPESLEFSHILLRDALYWSLAPSRRAELHARAARITGARPDGAALAASHWLSAGDAAPLSDIVTGVVRAVDAALARYATEAAISLLDAARTKLAERLDENTSLTLELALAESLMRQGAVEEAQKLAVACAERAKRLGRPEEQAEAALVYAAELASGRVDETMVRLLEEALVAVPQETVALRAKVLVRLAAAIVPPRSEDDMHRGRAMAAEAMALARGLGEPKTYFYVLRFAASALGYAINQKERQAHIEELMPLARTYGDDLYYVTIGGFYIGHLFETGRPDQARAEAEEYYRRVTALPLPQVQWRVAGLRASIAALDGQFDEALAHGTELRRLALETGAKQGVLAWSLLQIAVALCNQNLDYFATVEVDIRQTAAGPTFAPWIALAHALMGRREEAREFLKPVLAMPKGYPWLITAGQVTVLLEDKELAEIFYPLLGNEVLTGRLFWGPAGLFPIGPTSRVLGELAMILGKNEEARAHLEEAQALCRRIGAKALLDSTERAIGRLEARAAAAGVEGVGGAAVAGAGKEAEKTGRAGVTVSLMREGDVWVVASNLGATVRIKHAKGVEYLAALLETPRREHHVLALAGGGEAAEDAGTVLDVRAKDAYRRRVADLEDQIAEAERNGDAGRAERAQEELEAITAELAGAVGLGGRDKKAASNVQRARINVQRRIKDTIERISEVAPEVGRYLEATVRTGVYCSWEPL